MDPPGLPSFLRVARKAGTEPRARNRFPAGHLSVFGLYLPVFVDELRRLSEPVPKPKNSVWVPTQRTAEISRRKPVCRGGGGESEGASRGGAPGPQDDSPGRYFAFFHVRK